MQTIKWTADGDGGYVVNIRGTRVEIRRSTAHGWTFTLDDGGRTTYNGFPARISAYDAASRLVASLAIR